MVMFIRFPRAFTFIAIFMAATFGHADDGSKKDPENKRLAARLAETMKKLSERTDLIPVVSIKDGVMLVAGHSVRIVPISEQVATANDKFVSAARFEVTIDDAKQEQLSIGSIGIGDSADDATNRAVLEWYLQFGSALFRGIAATSFDLKISGLRIYKGAPGIRGEPPQDLLDGSTVTSERIFKAIVHLLAREDHKLHSVLITLVIDSHGEIEGECRVDGQLSASILSALKTLPWPKGDTQYMYKRSYVFQRE
jgi:hypothetical protein